MKSYICIRGGLGNQMFEYAACRNYALINNYETALYIEGRGKQKHEVFGLEHCNIPKDIEIVNKKKLSALLKISDTIYYNKFLEKIKLNTKIINFFQPVLNSFGTFYYPVGYRKFKKVKKKEIMFYGYFQCSKFFKENDKIICNELRIKDEIAKENKEIYKKICNTESICIHIRRGDYVGSNFEVCTKKYYEKAIELICNRINNPIFFCFSDNIEWVKENIDFKNKEVIYVSGNDQYQDLKLMYSCKHFIISNSSYSWWAQHLAENKEKIIIAPSIWLKNKKNSDIYEDNWELIDVKE